MYCKLDKYAYLYHIETATQTHNAMTTSAIFIAAHAATKLYIAEIKRISGQKPAYREVFALRLKDGFAARRAAAAKAIALAAALVAAEAANPTVTLVLALSYRDKKAQSHAKSEGFRYDAATQTWSKQGRKSEVGSYLRSLVIEQAAAPVAARPALEKAPAYATRAQRRHFEAEQGVFGASVSWGDCF